MPWNGCFTNRGSPSRWLDAARAAGVDPLVAFNHSSGDHCPGQPCRAPVGRAVPHALPRLPQAPFPWVRTFAPWNEANHQSQPTGKRPRRAAEYFNVVRADCRGCTDRGGRPARLLQHAALARGVQPHVKSRPSLWGLHNYTDANRFRPNGTQGRSSPS